MSKRAFLKWERKIYFYYAKQRKIEQKAYLTIQIFNFVIGLFQVVSSIS